MKKVVVQIGWYRLRDKSTKRFLPAAPLFKKVSPQVAEAFAERTATLLVDCYNDYENGKNFDFNTENNPSENYIKSKILVSPNQKFLENTAVKTTVFKIKRNAFCECKKQQVET